MRQREEQHYSNTDKEKYYRNTDIVKYNNADKNVKDIEMR